MYKAVFFTLPKTKRSRIMDNTIKCNVADSVLRISASDTCTNCVTTALPSNPAVTMAYVPFQLDKTAYSPEVALCEGTLFKTLNKPFCGRSIMNE